MVSRVLRVVAPAKTGTRPRTTLITVSTNPCSSSQVSVAHSPNVPVVMIAFAPELTNASTRRADSSRSTVSSASQRSAPGFAGVGITPTAPLMSFAVNFGNVISNPPSHSLDGRNRQEIFVSHGSSLRVCRTTQATAAIIYCVLAFPVGTAGTGGDGAICNEFRFLEVQAQRL